VLALSSVTIRRGRHRVLTPSKPSATNSPMPKFSIRQGFF
jgi:hypothetical protein